MRETSMSGHQRPYRGASDDWLTPPAIVEALGPFDLDPCAATNQPWKTARVQYTEVEDGLAQEWQGYTWLNPPFGPEAERWLKRLAEHGDGIALAPARTETRWFIGQIWRRAEAVLFLHSRPHFHHANGVRASANSGAPICLIAYGGQAREKLLYSGLVGSFVEHWIITDA